MGKRNVVMVSSSEEDADFGVRTRSTHRISSSKSNPGPCLTGTTSRAPKRARRRHSESHSASQKPALGNFDALCEDFYDGFQELRKVTGPRRKDTSELWVDKYRPQSLAELAVQKKKVEEVKIWLKERLITSKEKLYGHVLVITGQAGVGKSATIQVIASNLGARMCEWNTPTPTLWKEHIHNMNSGHDPFLLSARFARLPLKMDAPEKVLCQASGQARPIADFLHENVLDFLSDEAMDDAWTVASYLCDADNLATLHGSQMTNIYEPESIPQSAAASVAVRGVLFGNLHPSQPRWHAIRSPKLWQVEQLSRRNKSEMVRQRNNGDLVVMATEYKPALRWLGHGVLEAPPEMYQEENGSEDDEIQDW